MKGTHYNSQDGEDTGSISIHIKGCAQLSFITLE